MTSETWVAERCHDLEGKGVGGKGQGSMTPVINRHDVSAKGNTWMGPGKVDNKFAST